MMEITLQEFLRRKGAIGMLSLLHERPRTYSEIEPEIEVTSDTIITRRDEAADLGLMNISLGEAENGTKKVYHLTEMGEFLTERMAREGLISNYRKMRTLEELVDEQTEDFVTWVGENPSQLLQFEEAQDGTILRDSRPSRTSSNSQEDSGTAKDGGDGIAVDSNMSDSSVEHPEPPSEHGDTEDTGDMSVDEDSTEDGGTDEDDAEKGATDDNDDTERAQRPSDRTSTSVNSSDSSNLKQGSLSETATEDSDTESDDDDSGSES
uniref:hypothetical protein n=1 Tax=Halobacterium sp. (strain GN101) TaxID=88773 RepID=UPI00159EBC83|nr:hypothetical protein [Halobacterium sp. GN101]